MTVARFRNGLTNGFAFVYGLVGLVWIVVSLAESQDSIQNHPWTLAAAVLLLGGAAVIAIDFLLAPWRKGGLGLLPPEARHDGDRAPHRGDSHRPFR
jgi:hypothetical protein